MTNKDQIDTRTIKDFGDQWTRFQQHSGWSASLDFLQDLFGNLLSVEELNKKSVADIGAGQGRVAKLLLEAGARQVTAIEPSEAYEVMKRNLDGESKVKLVQDVGEAIGNFEDLDFVFSFGVLHHIKDPQPVVSAAHQALKPGGRIVIWLYGHEGNELYLRTFGFLRGITKRMPDWALSLLSSILNVALDTYIFLCKFIPLPMHEYATKHLAKLDRQIRKITIFDQLNPAYAKYYRKEEAIKLLSDSGFNDINIWHRHNYSWTVVGTKNPE